MLDPRSPQSFHPLPQLPGHQQRVRRIVDRVLIVNCHP
jgi:hypothetical protein